MSIFASRPAARRAARRAPMIESLESRAYLSASTGTPSLAVTLPVTLPASVISGTTVKQPITVNIANDGDGRAHERASIAIYASTDRTVSSDDAQLGVVTRTINIAPQRNQNIRIHLNPLPQNLNGTFYVLAQVTGTLPSVDGASVGTVTVSPPNIDLQPSVLHTPAKGHVGRAISITVDVANNGNSELISPVDFAFGLSPTGVATDAVAIPTVTKKLRIRAHRHQVVHLRTILPANAPTGNQYLVVNVDPSHLLADVNFGNNVAVGQTPISIS